MTTITTREHRESTISLVRISRNVHNRREQLEKVQQRLERNRKLLYARCTRLGSKVRSPVSRSNGMGTYAPLKLVVNPVPSASSLARVAPLVPPATKITSGIVKCFRTLVRGTGKNFTPFVAVVRALMTIVIRKRTESLRRACTRKKKPGEPRGRRMGRGETREPPRNTGEETVIIDDDWHRGHRRRRGLTLFVGEA